MTTLAIHGGKPEVVGPIPAFNTIGWIEELRATTAMHGPLSGFLAGRERGGRYVCALEDKWAETFGVRHAVACNSATSGLLAAAFAVGLKRDDKFIVSPYTMSATAAAPMFTGADPVFADVEDETFGISTREVPNLESAEAMVLTNLFGHTANEGWWTDRCRWNGVHLIVDNSQSPFAMENGRYAGTIGHIGVFSLNVHKHIQGGEGGICVTNDDELAHKLRAFVNHGESSGGPIGLNLRMTEVTAAIALAQLAKADQIIAGRIEQAEAIIEATKGLPGLRPPVVREGCTHVYYTIPWLFNGDRSWFVRAMAAEGVPLQAGYQEPLYRLPAFAKFARDCPVAERLWSRELLMWENCAYSPSKEQIAQIGSAFHKVIETMEKTK